MRPGRRLVLTTGASLFGLGLVGGCVGSRGRAVSGVTQDYSGALRAALAPYADHLKGYHYRATPLGNFGVGSMYLDEVRTADPSRAEEGWFLGGPTQWLAAQLPEDARRQQLGKLVSEGTLGPLNLNARSHRALQSSLGTAVFAGLGLGAQLNSARGAEVQFSASEVRQRRLNWAEFLYAVQSGLVAPAVVEVVQRGNFVLAAADLVLLNYQAEVVTDETLHPAFTASLRAKSLQARPKTGLLNAGLSLHETARGRFVVSSPQPLVAAVLFKRAPVRSKDISSPPTDLSAWPVASVTDATWAALEQRFNPSP